MGAVPTSLTRGEEPVSDIPTVLGPMQIANTLRERQGYIVIQEE